MSRDECIWDVCSYISRAVTIDELHSRCSILSDFFHRILFSLVRNTVETFADLSSPSKLTIL